MIPENITRGHMLRIISYIQAGKLTIRSSEHSQIYCLVHEGRHYPPAFIVRMASVLANGKELWDHRPGWETNYFCESRGFTIVSGCGTGVRSTIVPRIVNGKLVLTRTSDLHVYAAM